ncbi:murein hydrolase activator EnvC family protein [Aurantivibrio infirmus]
MKIFFRLLLLASVMLITLPSIAQDSQASEGEQKAKLEELKQTIEDLKQELESIKNDRDGLSRDLENNETDISDLLEKIEKIKAELGEQEQALQQLNSDRKLLAQEQNSQKKHIAQQVRAAYQLGGQSNIKLLLNQDSPEAVTRMLRYHDYFLSARTEKLADYLLNITKLDKIEPKIIETKNSLEKNQQTLKSRYSDLSKAQEARKKNLARLEKTIVNKDSQLQKLAQDRQRVEKVLNTIREASGSRPFYSSSTSFSSLRGKLPWPTKGKIAHRYGSDRVAGRLKWDGVLIQAEEGSPVQVIHNGMVIFADYMQGYGLLIIVDHGDGYWSLYAHNQMLTKNVGTLVSAGETIAQVGNSGGQNQAGLYFQIRKNGETTNPGQWCG